MGFVLDSHSVSNLVGVHNDLVRVVDDCAVNGTMPFKFGVSQGLRTLDEQAADVAAGKSQTMKSRHLDGHAVDLVAIMNGQCSWAWAPYYALGREMKAAAARCNVPITWGGDWLTLKDGPHFELPWLEYPSADAAVA